MVAVNKKTGQVVAVGMEAKEMLGRTPGHVRAVQPLIDGVISDFEVTEEMLSYLINKAQAGFKLLGPRVVVGIPSGITGVETRAVRDAAMNAGARDVHIVEEPMAAAIGIGLPVHAPQGSMVIDIGGGTTDIGIISLSGIVKSRNIKIAGDKLNNDIVTYIRNEFKILIGDKSAEDTKIAVAAVSEEEETLETTVRGRDLVTGLPREILVTDSDIREAIHHSITQLVDIAKEILEATPPELVADIYRNGIYLAGGGALIRGLAGMLSEMLGGVKVVVADDPLTAVVRGTGIILDDIDQFRESLKEHANQLSPTT
jgi:rod shape-determining protein MreB